MAVTDVAPLTYLPRAHALFSHRLSSHCGSDVRTVIVAAVNSPVVRLERYGYGQLDLLVLGCGRWTVPVLVTVRFIPGPFPG